MKHQQEISAATVERQDTGELRLYPVLGADDAGTPFLMNAPAGTALVVLEPMTGPAEGRAAVCKPFGDNQLAVLGYVGTDDIARAAALTPGPREVVLGTGKAKLRLTADGRVRIEAEDVQLKAHGRLKLAGARVDLN